MGGCAKVTAVSVAVFLKVRIGKPDGSRRIFGANERGPDQPGLVEIPLGLSLEPVAEPEPSAGLRGVVRPGPTQALAMRAATMDRAMPDLIFIVTALRASRRAARNLTLGRCRQ